MREEITVYRHRRNDTNEIFYIGIGKTEKRAYSIHSRNKHWKHIVNKVGYSVEIIDKVGSWELACELEQFLIQEYGRRDLETGALVNLTEGGDGSINRILSPETKNKISLKAKGRFISQEHKDKISNTLKGRNSKKVIDNTTGVIYTSVKEVSELFGLNYNTLRNQLNGSKKNYTNFKQY